MQTNVDLKRNHPTLYFLDPPYVEQGTALYEYAYDSRDHLRLAHRLNQCNASWVLTYDDVPLIRRLYQGRAQEPLHLNHSAAVKRKSSEVLILSDDL